MSGERVTLARRDALVAIAALGPLAACGAPAARPATPAPAPPPPQPPSPAMPAPVALAGNHQPIALPFPAGSLRGISEGLITSHHQKNYGGAVKNLNRVEQELSHVTAETPPFVVAALRERELTFRNSKALHEAYFANLGGSGKRGGAIETALGQAYGTSARWEEHFRATGLGLGGGSGWVVLAMELDTGALRTTAAGNHTQALASGAPLLVMDMYEHAYQMDHGAEVAKYVEAFFANVQWDEVNRRLERAQKAATALRA